MFGLLRWLFLLAVIAALAGFFVAGRFRGHTPAEGICKLWHQRECALLAQRAEAQVLAAKRRFFPGEAPLPAKRDPRDGTPHAARGAPGASEPTAPPLDHHTDDERRSLNRILTSRGSR